MTSPNKTAHCFFLPSLNETLDCLIMMSLNKPESGGNGHETPNCRPLTFSYFPILFIAAILNMLGLFLIFKDRYRQTNQNLILAYLNTTELVYALSMLILWFIRCHASIAPKTKHSLIRIAHSCYFIMKVIMVIMTFDRLIATKYPLRYVLILTKKKAHIVLASLTFLCIIAGVVSFFLDYDEMIGILDSFVSPISSLCIAVFILASYTYIFIAISRRRKTGNSPHNNRIRRASENHQFLKMATVITFTFSACYVVPDVFNIFCHRCYAAINIDIYRLLWYLGLVFDPITYIFMRKRLRKQLMEKVGCLCCRVKHQSGRDNFPGDDRIARSNNNQPTCDTRL